MFDRSVDMITPLCTQFVFEGIIDDYFGINFNSIKVDPKILEKDAKTESIKLDLSKNEKFYTQIKDFNFDKIKIYLPNKLREHNRILEESKNKKMDIIKIQESIDKIKAIKEERPSLTNMINLADYIARQNKIPKKLLYLNHEQSLLLGETPSTLYEFIDNELANKNEEYNILRIICLESLIHGGLKNKIYDQIKRDFINIYGFQEIFLLHNLEKMNILRYYESSNNIYSDLYKKLKLINDSVNTQNPNDSSYSYGGYCPINIRLIEKAFTKGWNSIKDLLNKMPGEFDFPKDESKIIENSSKEKKFVLLVFIGGITYGELASIRYLNQTMENTKFIVLTTSMINSKKVFNSLRQGKYKYVVPDESFINNSDSNTFKIDTQGRFTFKEFAEQSKF
jgi:hypothetical protein